MYNRYTVPKYLRHFVIGLWQGNGCASQLWSNKSSIVLSALSNQGFGIHFVKCFTMEIEQLLLFSHIYDFDVIQMR